MSAAPRRTVVRDLGYLEGARWYRDALWFSDLKLKRVHRLGADGDLTTVVEVPTTPSGLGFAADGSVLIMSLGDGHLLQLAPDGQTLTDIADLGEIGVHPNDMAVDHEGRVYASHFGFNWFDGEALKPTGLIVRHPDGRQELAGSGLEFPNGVAISQDRTTLYVSESFGSPNTRLTAFDVGTGGTLANQRTIHEFGPPETHVVDGICIDVEDGVWVSLCLRGEYHRVLPDGTVTDVIAIPPEGGNYVVDSALGGPDMRTLYMLVADATVERIADGFDTTARIDAIDVDVPGVRLEG
jgi:sugar lactone lactonase YvrE